jgi:hypothetical protein
MSDKCVTQESSADLGSVHATHVSSRPSIWVAPKLAVIMRNVGSSSRRHVTPITDSPEGPEQHECVLGAEV